jgi:hypothetical protein
LSINGHESCSIVIVNRVMNRGREASVFLSPPEEAGAGVFFPNRAVDRETIIEKSLEHHGAMGKMAIICFFYPSMPS